MALPSVSASCCSPTLLAQALPSIPPTRNLVCAAPALPGRVLAGFGAVVVAGAAGMLSFLYRATFHLTQGGVHCESICQSSDHSMYGRAT